MSITATELKEIVKRLKRYNKWRRGADNIKMPDPKQTGIDIAIAIKILGDIAKAWKSDEGHDDVFRKKATKKTITPAHGTVLKYTRATDNK